VGTTAEPSGRIGVARGASITDDGLAVDGAWARFADDVCPTVFSLDSSRFLAFIRTCPRRSRRCG
jgi:hypothetical protein